MFWTWISYHIHVKLWSVITHSCFNFDDDSPTCKPPLKFDHDYWLKHILFHNQKTALRLYQLLLLPMINFIPWKIVEVISCPCSTFHADLAFARKEAMVTFPTEIRYPTQITDFMGPNCRPQMGPMLAPWTLLSGKIHPSLCHPYHRNLGTSRWNLPNFKRGAVI